MKKEVIFCISLDNYGYIIKPDTVDEKLVIQSYTFDLTRYFPKTVTESCNDKGYELNETYTLPNRDFYIDWGDATKITHVTNETTEIRHEYIGKGDYQIRIYGEHDLFFDSTSWRKSDKSDEKDLTYDQKVDLRTKELEWKFLKLTTTEVKVRKSHTCPFIVTKQAFDGFEKMTNVSYRIFENCKEQKSFNRAFFGCSSLNRISKHLFKWSPNVVDFSQVFRKCISVVNVPIEIFKYNKKARNFKYSFYLCGNSDSEMITDGLFNYLELTDEDRINVFLTFSGDFVGGTSYTHGQTGVKVDQNLFVDITEHLDSRFGQTEDYTQMRPFTTNANIKHIKFGDTLKMSNMQWLVDNGGCQIPTELLTVKLPKTILNFDGTVPSSINIGWGLRNNENLHTVYWFDIPEVTTSIELVDAMISCKSLRRIYNFNCSTYKYDSSKNTYPNWNDFNGDAGLFIDTTLDEETLSDIVTTMGSWVGYTGTDNRNVIVVGCCTEAYNSADTLFTEEGDTVTVSTHRERNCKVCYDASKNFTYKILDNETYWNNQASTPTTLELIEGEIDSPTIPEE